MRTAMHDDITCAAARDVRLLGGDGAALAREARHRTGCAKCQADAQSLAIVRAAIERPDPVLDDLTRARMHARISEGLRAPQRTTASWFARWRLAFALPVATCAAVVLAFGLGTRVGHHDPQTVARKNNAAIIRPFGVTGALPKAADVVATRDVSQLDVPAGARVRARLRDRARLTLIGPAHLEVSSASEGIIVLHLVEGTLVGDYDHQRGGTLRIVSPGAVTDVVGTLFSIEVHQGASRVSVSHGLVSVRAGEATPRLLGGGRAWVSASPDIETIDAADRERFGDHEAAVAGVAASAAAPAGQSPAVPQNGPVAPPSARRRVAPAPAMVAWSDPATRPAEPTPRPSPVTLDRGAAAEPSADTTARASADAPLVPTFSPPTPEPAAPMPAAAPPAVAAAKPAAPLETSTLLYQRAERALAAGDRDGARVLLDRVVERFSSDSESDLARFELAQMALARGDRREASRHVDRLLASPRSPALRESAGFLHCRLLGEGGDVGASRSCLQTFRADHPSSPHDAAALALLIGHAHAAATCNEGRALAEEYLWRYPSGAFAAQARRAIEACRR